MTRDPSKPVVVVGAGAAGMAAAISAARQGARVLLLEKGERPGGTVAQSLIHTLGGLYDSEGAELNSGLARELVDRLQQAASHTRPRKIGRVWVLNVDPSGYQTVVDNWLGEEERLAVLPRATVTRVDNEGGRVSNIEWTVAGSRESVQPLAVIDATGSAEAVRLVDASLVVDEAAAAAGLVFQLRVVEAGVLQFPRSVELLQAIRRAVERGQLPKQCAQAWLDTGVEEDEAYVKLFVPLGPNWREPAEAERATQAALAARDALVAFLRQRPGFAAARLGITGTLGIRDGGRVKGEYTLTAADVREGRKFPDAAARCCWPIEYWDPTAGVTLQYLPPGQYYEIPLRSLKVRGLANLWVAGKCLSAEHLAQASARVVGCCWAMGEAAGKAAAQGK